MLRAIALLAGFACLAPAGDLTERYRLTLDRVLTGGPPRYGRDFVLADAIPRHVRRFTQFSGDLSGRYIGALAVAAADLGGDHRALDRLVSELLLLQKPDGHFGDPASAGFLEDDDMAMLWGNGRLLIGLLEYYRLTKREEVLRAATRLGEYLVRVAPTVNSRPVMERFQAGKFAVGYICWTQNSEGLAELYRVTARPEFKRLIEEMAARTVRRPGQHSHGFLTTLRGLVELYRITGESRWLEQAEREVEGVVGSGNLLAHGAVPEGFRPGIHRDEGCTEADWLRLNLALWRETGKREYLERAETTLFNEFALNQFASGDFGHRVFAPLPPERGRPQDFQPTGVSALGERAWWCCTLHGLRCFADVRRAAFRFEDDALYYDLPVDSEINLPVFEMTADSTLSRDGTVVLTARRGSGKRLTLRIRRPGWARGIEARLNQKKLAAGVRDGYLEISRKWRGGDVVELRYSLRTFQARVAGGDGVVLQHGPWILGVDAEATPGFFDRPGSGSPLRRLWEWTKRWMEAAFRAPSWREGLRCLWEWVKGLAAAAFGEPGPQRRLRLPAAEWNGDLDLEPAQGDAEVPTHRFAVPAARFRVEYLPGGYPAQPATALLRPIAEQTGMPTTSWMFVFRRDERK